MRDHEQDCIEGYRDGADLASPAPGPNRPAAYAHGFMCGREDTEIRKGIRQHPEQAASARLEAWERIVGAAS